MPKPRAQRAPSRLRAGLAAAAPAGSSQAPGLAAPAALRRRPSLSRACRHGNTGGTRHHQILSGPNSGKELPLLKPLTTLGKPGVQVAVIARRPQGYFITHVEGANFPAVNGKVLDAQAHLLNDHDIIELAGVKMEFFLKS
jgi:hypothetical protein